ncbi:MAG: hypothetical protein WEB06_04015 [Actinomycetota bacterium]
MLRRVLVPVLAVWIAWTAVPAASAHARQGSGRIVLLTVDGTTIEDWRASEAFASLGSVGLLATRTRTSSADQVLLRSAAYTTLGAGAAAEVEPGPPDTDAGRGVLAGALGEALSRAGLGAAAIGDASGEDRTDAPARRAAMRADLSIAVDPSPGRPRLIPQTWRTDPSSPAGRRTDYQALLASLSRTLSWATLVVVDLGDTVRADQAFAGEPSDRAPWIARALREANDFTAEVRTLLDPGDTLIVASLVPPLARVRSGTHLAAVALSGARGLPFSGTTRRPGVLALTDLAPTILERAGVAVPEEMQGRAARFAASADPLRTAAELDAEFDLARASRQPLTRIWMILGAALSLMAFLAVAAGRGRAPDRERLPRRGRDLIATGLLAVAAAPAGFMLAPLLGDGVAPVGWWALALAVGVATCARVTLGVRHGLGAIALLDVALVAGDLFAGTPLSARSALGIQIAGGGRFYGIDEGMLGVLLAGALVAGASWVDASVGAKGRAATAAVPLAAVALLAGAPAFGSKFGAPFTLVPAFGVFVVLAAGRRLDRAAAVGIGIATVLAASTLAVLDVLSSPESRSHIGRELAGGTPVGPLIGRKLSSFLEITGTTIWLPVAIVISVPVLLLLLRRMDLLARGFWGMPGRRAALVAAVVGGAAAMASNDTGIIVVTPTFLLAAAAFYGPLLAPPRRGRSLGATKPTTE